MNKILLLLSLVLVTSLSADELDIPHVSVVGRATIDVTPDKMIWELTVEVIEDDVSEVAELHDKKVAEVLKFLTDNGIKKSDLQTTDIRLSENKVRRDREYVKEGYRSSTNVTFETSEIGSYRELWIGISKIPNVSINKVLFDTSDRIKYQNESRINAVKVAKVKAESLAKALGSTVHEPLVIEEDSTSRSLPWNSNTITNGVSQVSNHETSSGGSLSLGTISISTQVGVTFRISSNKSQPIDSDQ